MFSGVAHILIILSWHGPATTQEFQTKNACEFAREQVLKEGEKFRSYEFKALCVPKACVNDLCK